MTYPQPIRVEVPVCAFRPYASREYQDTFPVPAPSSVYGMLLSLIGEPPSPAAVREERHLAKEKHRGTEMALAVSTLPERAKVFRKLRRGSGLEDTRPDYQDLLMDLTLWIWLRPGQDQTAPSLSERVRMALDVPESLSRFGGLSLGESSYLIDTIAYSIATPPEVRFLRPAPDGFYSLPVWVDHQDSRNTMYRRFSIDDPKSVEDGLSEAWFGVGVP